MVKPNSSCFTLKFNLFPNDKFSNTSKLKELADDNFEFDENGRKFSRRVENTVRKGEIACDEQFLFFPQCFQKTCTADTCLFGKGVKQFFEWKHWNILRSGS